MRILGVDPGSRATGYGMIETDGMRHRTILFGAVTTSARRPFHQRLLEIFEGLDTVLRRHPADVMAIEGVFHSVNVQAALKLGHARGVALVVAALRGLDVREYSPLEIKNAVVGFGRAEKIQVQTMVQLILGLPEIPSPDHAADALAVAICHAHRMKGEDVRR
ncbi:MAG: crossover junction endodeoxyribonuclease RuvC [Acidobacteriota bacterium]|jgi:crossover junction endodeoxyribonuclease RuvC|nr:crossover junction endodeoxyribonuclease RuvC [Acidobacteriota bacterium]NLT33187.1 crossover junction endodeoxyribonuclease RuvC [Acidobacteriota bacterium]